MPQRQMEVASIDVPSAVRPSKAFKSQQPHRVQMGVAHNYVRITVASLSTDASRPQLRPKRNMPHFKTTCILCMFLTHEKMLEMA